MWMNYVLLKSWPGYKELALFIDIIEVYITDTNWMDYILVVVVYF